MEKKSIRIWLQILSFVIPVVGIYLYFSKKDDMPSFARNCLMLALAAIVIGFVLAIILSPMA